MRRIIALLAGVWLATIAPAFAGAEEEMMAADRAFAAMAQHKGVPVAFAAYAAEDVRMFPAGDQPYAGRDQLIAAFADWPEGARLDWTPQEAVAAPGGKFGFTWGRYVFTAPTGAEGHGKYVSVWRKEKNGGWKFVADIGNSNPAPGGSD